MIKITSLLTRLTSRPLTEKKVNKLIRIVDTSIPGSSYEELEKFKKDLAIIAQRNKVKARIYDARRELGDLHTASEEEFLSKNIAVILKRRGREAVRYLVNYFGQNGDQENSFINRFFADFELNSKIAKNKKIKL